jgi:hypothetical protein
MGSMKSRVVALIPRRLTLFRCQRAHLWLQSRCDDGCGCSAPYPVEGFIPDPLPPPQLQWLRRRGSNMVVTRNGKKMTYGPCYRPAPINRLWAVLAPSGPGG